MRRVGLFEIGRALRRSSASSSSLSEASQSTVRSAFEALSSSLVSSVLSGVSGAIVSLSSFRKEPFRLRKVRYEIGTSGV